ncbi:MAG: quinone-dependent dihydroorotate dehydrogenase [Candidatus Doudnabacteria bacterium]|nr:quinone-dependent dihydroorotate dehydrogenase [Candidatus Doudnabacteria bacterium]
MYKLIRPILFQIPAETVYGAVAKTCQAITPFSGIFEKLFAFEHPMLETEVFGMKFKNPVGLAPGYDKFGAFTKFLSALGFGFIEVGSITPLPQPGNPKPRMFRLTSDEALVNRMGFNSIGMHRVAENLKKISERNFILGVNLGKNKATSNEHALQDYLAAFNYLAPLADYVVVNVSSPNTPGLRQLQNKAPLLEIFKALQQANQKLSIRKPLLLKVAPDLSNGQLDDIAAIVLETKIDGIIANNTTVSRDGLKTSPEEIRRIGEGGLSGRPIAKRTTEVISYLYQRLQGRTPIIGAGGIFSAEDAYEKIKAGASLVQVYTGIVYEGPGLIKKIKQGLVELLKRDGFKNIAEAVGKSKTPT